MKEFLKKNGAAVTAVGTYVGAIVGMAVTYIVSVVKSDRRQANYYKKATESQEAQAEFWRSRARDKES